MDNTAKLLTSNRKEQERRMLKKYIKQIDKIPKDKLYTYKDVFGEDLK